MGYKELYRYLEDHGDLNIKLFPSRLRIRSITFFLYALAVLRSEHHSKLWAGCVSRSVKASEDGEPHYCYTMISYLRLLSGVGEFIAKEGFSLIWTSTEPYGESVALRIIAEVTNSPAIAVWGRNYIAINRLRENKWEKLFSITKGKELLTRIKVQIRNDYPGQASISARGSFNRDIINTVPEANVTSYHDISGRVVIFCHDLFDAVNMWGPSIFPSLVQWLVFTVRTLKHKKIEFLLKPHPNQSHKSARRLNELIEEYSLQNFILDSVDTETVLSERPSAVVSNHGSVLIDAAVWGVPVATCGTSLSSLLGITPVAKNRSEYRRQLVQPRSPLVHQAVAARFASQFTNNEKFDHVISVPLIWKLNTERREKIPVPSSVLKEDCRDSRTHKCRVRDRLECHEGEKLIGLIKNEARYLSY